jgi:hypothetical protein
LLNLPDGPPLGGKVSWRLSRRTGQPDGLDLLFFLFVYYHHGLERDLQWVSAQARLF